MSTVEPPPLPNSLSQLHLFLLFLFFFFIHGPLHPISVAQMHMRTSDQSGLNTKWEVSVSAPPPRLRKHPGKGGGKTVREGGCHVFWTGQGLLNPWTHSYCGCPHETHPDNIPAWRGEGLTRPHPKHHTSTPSVFLCDQLVFNTLLPLCPTPSWRSRCLGCSSQPWRTLPWDRVHNPPMGQSS